MTATMFGLLLTIGAVLSFMYASNILVPFEIAVVSVIFAFIIYLVGRRGKTGPKGEHKSSGGGGKKGEDFTSFLLKQLSGGKGGEKK
jgi:hypothetical protein